jgi:glycosyltransferase involved in cell wall biosynthesis
MQAMEDILVTVIVLTYNSSPYVVETLESIKAQTYQNIELVVTDDCSTDGTLSICKEWLDTYGDRFVRIKLVTSTTNTGIAPNLNRGIKVAKGDWIKPIAGDDALFPFTIEKYIDYIQGYPDIKVVHSNVASYEEFFDEDKKLPVLDASKFRINQKDISAKEQYQILLRIGLIRAPTVMLKREVFNQVGYFDESCPLWEDRPMWLKLTKNNIKLQYIDFVSTKYRVSKASVQYRKKTDKLFTNLVLQKNTKYVQEYLHELSLFEKVVKGSKMHMISFIDRKGFNKQNSFMKVFYKYLSYPLAFIGAKIDRKYY